MFQVRDDGRLLPGSSGRTGEKLKDSRYILGDKIHRIWSFAE